MQQQRERHLGMLGDRVPQRERAVRRQLQHQPIRQRTDHVVLVGVGPGLLARHGDDGAGAAGALRRITAAIAGPILFHILGLALILGPDIAALDGERPVGLQADEGAGDGHVFGCVDDRPLLEADYGRLEFAKPRVDFLRQLVRVLVFVRERVVLALRLLELPLLVLVEFSDLPIDAAQAVRVAVRQLGRDLDPAPAFRGHALGLSFKLLRHQRSSSAGSSSQPPSSFWKRSREMVPPAAS